MLYLERLDGHPGFILFLHHFNQLANHLVSHIVDVPPSLRSRRQAQDPIWRINVISLNRSDTKWLGEQPNMYLAAKGTWPTSSVCLKMFNICSKMKI